MALTKREQQQLAEVDRAIGGLATARGVSFIGELRTVVHLENQVLDGMLWGFTVEYLVKMAKQLNPWFWLVIDGHPMPTAADIEAYDFSQLERDENGDARFSLGVMVAIDDCTPEEVALFFDFGKGSLRCVDVS